MAQVYLIAHSDTHCLVFRKNRVCKFPRVYEPNGKGDWCFPGGKLKPGELPEAGAVREFEEETGIRLDGPFETIFPPSRAYYGVFRRMANDELERLCGAIARNLSLANSEDRKRWAESGIRDNELASVALVPIRELNTAYFRNGHPVTGWFYDLVMRYFL